MLPWLVQVKPHEWLVDDDAEMLNMEAMMNAEIEGMRAELVRVRA